MEMNIAKFIGITAIIAGHTKWLIFGELFTNGSWHVPLFFFISGYFFNINKELFCHIKKIACKYLGWFYGYHFFYGGITVLVYILFDRLYGKMPSIKTLTVSPIDSTPFFFSVPNWFLYQLAISLAIFAVIMFLKKKFNWKNWITTVFFLILAITAIFLSKDNFQASHGLIKIIIRTFITIFYIYAGWLYKNKLEEKVKFNTKWLGAVVTLQVISLLLCLNKCNLDINNAKLWHNMSPVLVPFTGIYFVLFISKLLAPLVKEGSFIDKAGRNTLHIMANHVFVIFIIELCIFIIDGKSFNELPNGLISHFYKMGKYKFLYTFGSLIICTYIGEGISYIAQKVKNRFSATVQQ